MLFSYRKKDIFTVPNLLTMLRIALIPVYTVIYVHADSIREYRIAAFLIAISCLTDLADGIIARKFHMISELGKILDPVADKATQFALILCLCGNYPSLAALLPMLIIKESFQFFAGVISLRKGKILTGALPAGKVATAVLFSSLTCLVLFPDIPEGIVEKIVLVNGILLLFSLAGYTFVYAGKIPGLRQLDTDSK